MHTCVATWIPCLFLRASLWKTAILTPSELNAWMLGSTFVDVSLAYTKFLTISVKMLSLGNTVGRRCNPFGNTVEIIKNMVIPIMRKHVT